MLEAEEEENKTRYEDNVLICNKDECPPFILTF